MDNHLLEQKINYTFKEKSLLELALTHCSFSAEHGMQNNQRLEFLGDAVLEAVISAHIYHRYPSFDEGKLTRLRVSIVSEEPLAIAAEELELNHFILLGVGEKSTAAPINRACFPIHWKRCLPPSILTAGIPQLKM